ncbi:Uncharacterised protein r2_g1954 [Pycnogonum litorale]
MTEMCLRCLHTAKNSATALAVKFLTFFPQNASKGLPLLVSTILHFDSETRILKAIIDCDSVTARRTAAASAVATKALLKSEPKTLAILGAGVQGDSHAEAFTQMFDFENIRIWNRTPQTAEKLSSKLSSKGQNCVACATVQQAVKDADVICTVTLSKEPILQKDWVKKGAIINAVGAPSPDQQELDPDLVRESIVVADSRQSAEGESGDVINSKAEVYVEIGEIMSGKKQVPSGKTIIFKSLGHYEILCQLFNPVPSFFRYRFQTAMATVISV